MKESLSKMFGLEEFLDTFGTLTVGIVVEILIAAVGVFVAYKKLKDKMIGAYEERKQQKDDIQEALDGVRALPNYRKQSLEIQNQLKDADDKILETCQKIQDGVNENHRILNERLDRLEDRERNALREKILHMHRMFTSVKRNTMQAWSEMASDSFND